MLPIKRVILPKSMEVVEFLPISDLHIGSAVFDEKVVIQFVEWVLGAPNRYTGIGGDIGNFALPGGKSDFWAERLTPNQQVDVAVKLLEPIKDRILYILDGNHDDRLYRAVGISPAEQLAARLGLADSYFEGVAFIALSFGVRAPMKKTYTGKKASGSHPESQALVYIHAEHGTGGGTTLGGKLNRSKKQADAVLANIYVMGHGHGQVWGQDILDVPSIAGGTATVKRWHRMYSMCAPMVAKEVYARIMATGNSVVGSTGMYTLFSADGRINYTGSNMPF